MINKEITIINKLGLHARASAKLSACASGYGCKIEIARGNTVINAKSIMGVLMLAASQGTVLEVRIDDSENETEAKEALEKIEALVNSRFGEEE